MNTSDSLPTKKNNIIFHSILKNWGNLEKSQKDILLKIYKVITYKWQLQILFNLPFLIWWLLDKNIDQVHSFDTNLINLFNLPDWVISMIGFGQSAS